MRTTWLRRVVALLGSQPTLLAQITNVAVSIGTFSAVARLVSRSDFGRYSAVAAAYAVVNGVVGQPIGARTIAQIGSSVSREIRIAPSRDFGATLAAMLAIAVVANVVGVHGWAAAWATFGAAAWVVTEVAIGVALGAGKLGEWGALLVGRQALMLGITVAIVPRLAVEHRLDGVFLAGTASLLLPAAYIAWRARIRRGPAAFPMAALGAAQLALWVIAAADRIIYGRFDPSGAAQYAAAYSVVDRGFRTVASAELPRALSAELGADTHERSSLVRPVTVVPALVLAVAVVPTLVPLLAGSAYRPSYLLVGLLSSGMALMTAAVPGYATLIGRRRLSVIGAGAVLIAAVNVGGNLLLIPSFGGLGAASVTLGSYAAWLGLIHMKLRAGRKATESRLRMPAVPDAS